MILLEQERCLRSVEDGCSWEEQQSCAINFCSIGLLHLNWNPRPRITYLWRGTALLTMHKHAYQNRSAANALVAIHVLPSNQSSRQDPISRQAPVLLILEGAARSPLRLRQSLRSQP